MNEKSIEYRPIVLPKATLDLLLKQDKPGPCIALYTFYYYTAIWQGSNTAKATTGYASNQLHWTENKVTKFKKVLIEIGLVKDVVRRNKQCKITGHFIQINYFWSESQLNKVINHSTQNSGGGLSLGVEKEGTNAYSYSKVNACSSNTDLETLEKTSITLKNNTTTGNKHTIPPTVTWVNAYAESIDFNLNGEQFCDFYEQKGWIVGKTKMKDWQAAIRYWKWSREDKNETEEEGSTLEDAINMYRDAGLSP